MVRPVDPSRRSEILEQAIAFLAENGLTGLTMRKLASALGISTTVISYQFGSRDGLIDAALTRARASSVEMLTSLRADDPGISVADAVRQVWAWWRAEPERFAYPRLNMEAMMTEEPQGFGRAKRSELVSFWVDHFVGWFMSEGRTQPEAEELSSLLAAALSGLVIDLICTGDTERVDRTMDRLALLIEP